MRCFACPVTVIIGADRERPQFYERNNLRKYKTTGEITQTENNPAAPDNTIIKGADAMNKKDKLALKKQTLEAWAHILYNEGMIDLARCSRMIERISKLTA